MTHSESIDKLAPALVQVQAHAGPALKQSNNPAFKSKYADLASCWEAVREPLAKAEIAVIQEATLTEAGVSVSTRLIHASGQWLETAPLTVPLGNKRDAHAVGSCVSYGKRYSLSAALGIVADDDDGNAAVAPAPASRDIDQDDYLAWKDHLAQQAQDGLDALKKAWQDSPIDYRTFLMKRPADAAWWQALKTATEKGGAA